MLTKGEGSRKPNRIHQILIRDGGDLPSVIPARVAFNAHEAQRYHPSAVYKLWSGAEIRAFILTHFGRRVSDAYDRLQPYAYRCDLGRLCVLYIEGGLYVDLGITLMNALQLPGTVEFAAF